MGGLVQACLAAFLIGSIVGQKAEAQWTATAQSMVQEFNKNKDQKTDSPWAAIANYVGWNDPYFASFWEVAGTRVVNKWRDIHGVDHSMTPFSEAISLGIPIASLGFGEPSSRHKMAARILWRKTSLMVEKAPLILYNPGLFQASDSPSTTLMAEKLSSLGFHVLVIANPFSVEYASRYPVAAVGSFDKEAELLNEALHSFVTTHDEYITKVHVLGASYGGFLSGILAALDAETYRHIDGQVSLIGPQVNLDNTTYLLDDMINESFATFSPKVFERIVGNAMHYGLRQAHLKGLESYAFFKSQGFQDRIYPPAVAASYDRLIEKRKADPELKGWQREIRFHSSLYLYTPENVELYESETGSLDYWLARAAKADQKRVRILTACDDFTNKCEWWKGLSSEFQQPAHLLIRKVGSHNAFILSGWFSNFLKNSF